MSQMDSYQMKHTPGPWDVTTSRDVFSAVIASGRATICMDVENDADAALIASAPDLLAALKGLLADDYDVAIECVMDGPGGTTEEKLAWKLIAERNNAARAAISKAEGVA